MYDVKALAAVFIQVLITYYEYFYIILGNQSSNIVVLFCFWDDLGWYRQVPLLERSRARSEIQFGIER